MTWLVTGGAGYIGAHVARAFTDAGMPAVVLDDLSTGHEAFVPAGVPLVRGSVLDGALVVQTMREHAVRGVVHLAGYKYAGVSVERPLHTYTQNVTGTVALLAAMRQAGVDRIVFSSSAAVYGTPDVDLVTEATPTRPESPYGETKLIGEWLLRAQGVATAMPPTVAPHAAAGSANPEPAASAPLRHTSLRYFNVIGSADDLARPIFDTSPHNLLPMVFDALLAGEVPRINGDDHATPDGTAVRDYVHVTDVAAAHVAAARRLEQGQPLESVYNLGSGTGVSVREMMHAIAEATELPFTPVVGPRRAGDPARIVADGNLAARDLDWTMRHSLRDTVRSAWLARTAPSVVTNR